MNLTEALRATISLHAAVYGTIVEVKRGAQHFELGNLVDRAYLLREIAKLGDDVRKEATVLREFLEKIACMRWTTQHLNDPKGAGPIRGHLATGTPDVRTMASLPRQSSDPEGYTQLMNWLGVPEATRELVRPHWPTFTEQITAMAEAGQPLPPGINADKTYPVYRLTLKKRRDLPEPPKELVSVGQVWRAKRAGTRRLKVSAFIRQYVVCDVEGSKKMTMILRRRFPKDYCLA